MSAGLSAAAGRAAADVETSSEDYARRFTGEVGAWFLDVQARAVRGLLEPWPAARVLDVGGGHGQLTGPLVEAGHEVTVLGTDPACGSRLAPWVDSGRARFECGPLVPLPYGDEAFDVAVCFRLLPHEPRWRELIGELCRVSRRAVVVDYPTRRSVNAFAGGLFTAKQSVEGNTRPFTVFADADVEEAFAARGFAVTARMGQFVLPMALHRALRRVALSRAAEAVLRRLGLRRLLGSPVILRAERRALPEPWAVRLFRRSALKQRKLEELERALGPTDGLRCLDLGSDNGVVSLMLRRRGGRWASGDLTEEAVASIRELVGSDVHHVEGSRLPFPDAEFDRVAVVDMLEHVPDDAAFVAELARITRPGGRLVVNTPNLKRTLLRRLRHAVGLTDLKHGHLRPGYSIETLRRLLDPHFDFERHRTYSRFFSELVDTAINVVLDRLGKKGSAKGMVVTSGDVRRHGKAFAVYGAIYPMVWLVTRLDALLPWTSGYMLLATARRRS